MNPLKKSLRIFITAGEASGDTLGAHLMQELRARAGDGIEFFGVGGDAMMGEELVSLFPMQDLSVMGLMEVLPRLRLILKRIGQTAQKIRELTPDVVVTIDAPDFSFRVAQQIRNNAGNLPLMVHYVAPTVWAWRPERAAKVAKLYDGLMCLFPFEPAYFEKEGMKAAFVGHPVMANSVDASRRAAFRKELDIPADAPVLGLLFGSRMGELNRTGPVLRDAAFRLAKDNPQTHIVALTLPHLKREVKNMLSNMPCRTHIVTGQDRKWDLFAVMDKAMAVSGTVGLELAAAGVPHVIGYRMNPVTWQIAKRKLTTKYAHLANILLDRLAVPEFIQGHCSADSLYDAVNHIDSAAQRAAFVRVREMLGGNAQDAADFILELAAPEMQKARNAKRA